MESRSAYVPGTAECAFFKGPEEALPLYAAFMQQTQAALPEFGIRVQKTQITLCNRHVFNCVSFLRVRPKALMPASFFTLTFGLEHPLESARIDAKVEAYRNRWTHHVVLSDAGQIDEELLSWLREAYDFAQQKR